MRDSIVIIGPHPDDVFISCAGLVLKHLDNYDFKVVCMTSQGHLGSGADSSTRLKEEKEAWSMISPNIEVLFFDEGVDTQLFKQEHQIIEYIESTIKNFNPTYIFAPYFADTHQDHRTVSHATMSACRYNKNILFYETPSTLSFDSNCYVELPHDILNKKKDLIKVYKSQTLGDEYTTGLEDYVYASALKNGTESRVCKFAEAFMSHKLFIF